MVYIGVFICVFVFAVVGLEVVRAGFDVSLDFAEELAVEKLNVVTGKMLSVFPCSSCYDCSFEYPYQ